MAVATSSFLTIVSGLPRSGTSMMMRMLERGGMPVIVDNQRQADDDNPNGYYEFEAVKKTRDDPSWLNDSTGKAVKMVYRLLYDLPMNQHYRVLFMRRKLDEVLASQRTMLERTGDSNDGINEETIANLFRSELSAFENWLKNQSHIECIDVDYNRIQREPEIELQRINDFLGGELDVRAMADVVDSSLYRNRL
jgi:hypothetical protein